MSLGKVECRKAIAGPRQRLEVHRRVIGNNRRNAVRCPQFIVVVPTMVMRREAEH